MLLPRVIPCLLLKGKGLVKGVNFKNHTYVGDPINAVQIFNSKLVDEIMFLDISARDEKRLPDLELLGRITDQVMVPFCVGGGIKTLEDARKVISAGAEKVCINTAATESPQVITQIAESFGKQSVVVSVDVKKNWLGKYEVFIENGRKKVSSSPAEYALQMQKLGAGEILLNSIDQDGTQQGYDIKLIRQVTEVLSIPVIAGCGAGKYDHLKQALHEGKADAVTAGSLFVFHGPRRAVLISFPNENDLRSIRHP